MARSSGKRIAVIVTDGFEQVEMTSPRQALEDAGARVDLLSDSSTVQGMNHHDRGDRFDVDAPLAGASADDCDGLVLPAASPTAMRCASSTMRRRSWRRSTARRSR